MQKILDFLRKYFSKPINKLFLFIGSIRWKQCKPLSEADRKALEKYLTTDYFVIATRRSNHLSTYFIALGNFLLSGKFSFYSHVLMNLEDTVHTREGFRFIEALSQGTVLSTFADVFGDNRGNNSPDAVALLKPVALTLDEWTKVLDKAKAMFGTPYDTLFDLKDNSKISCVELVRLALKELPNYEKDFAQFEKMIKSRNNLTPQMFVDCPDFHIVFEIKK